MPSVYFITDDGSERAATAALLANEGHAVEVFSDASFLLAAPDLDAAGCIVVDLGSMGGDIPPQLKSLLAALPIVVVCGRASVAFAVEAMKRGATDVIQKPFEPSRLAAAVQSALKAGQLRAERLRRKHELIMRYRSLSARERDVVGAVLEGRANREVASCLGISPRTVETHRSKAMNKLGARTLPELVQIWLDLEGAAAQQLSKTGAHQDFQERDLQS